MALSNGDSKNRLLNWFMGVATALLVAAVAGLWSMSAEVSRMSARMEAWSNTFQNVEARVHDIERDHKQGAHFGSDRRLNALEELHKGDGLHMRRRIDP